MPRKYSIDFSLKLLARLFYLSNYRHPLSIAIYGWFAFDGCSVEVGELKTGLKARVEVFYFGCCPYSYFFAYGGGFLDETWTRTGDDFKAELERFGVEVVEYNMLEHPELVRKLNLQVDPYNPFSSLARFLIDNKEISKEEFFQKLRETPERKGDESQD